MVFTSRPGPVILPEPQNTGARFFDKRRTRRPPARVWRARAGDGDREADTVPCVVLLQGKRGDLYGERVAGLPIPALNEAGFLPVGLHDCTVGEIRQCFGQFASSDRRPRLAEKLESFLEEARQAESFSEIIVDGSFVTSKPDPSDIDLILVLTAEHDVSALLRPFEYNLISRRRTRRRYGFDVLVARHGSAERDEYIAYFTQVRGQPTVEKGLLRVSP